MELRSLTILLEQEIKNEAHKLRNRHQAYQNDVHRTYERQSKLTKSPPNKFIDSPGYWKASRLHNPFYVYRRASTIAHSIARKLTKGTYAPASPYKLTVPKPDGGSRIASVFQIPDAAVSLLFYRRLQAKNLHRFSSYSYAYRADRTVQYAIQDLSIELSSRSRLFIAEFDFSKFFDRISHEFLRRQFSQNGFLMSRLDKQVAEAFLRINGDAGVPQGTSISLFLANLACWQLDYDLERLGVKFARYADDTVLWSTDYSTICSAAECVERFSRESGVPINPTKSNGIRLLTSPSAPAELASHTTSIEFLGYELGLGYVRLKNSVVSRIKADIGRILYETLIRPLKGPALRAIEIPANDQDIALLSAMSQIRRYIYGNLSEATVKAFLSGQSGTIPFKGALANFPLVDDEEQLKNLDGWLCSAVFRAVRKRGELLASWRLPRWHIFPFNAARDQLPKTYRSQKVGPKGRHAYEIPSFLRLYRAIYSARIDIGITGAGSSGYNN